MINSIFKYIEDEQNFNQIVGLYQEFVDLGGSGRTPELAQKAGDWLKTIFENEGFECEMIPNNPNAGLLVGILNKEIDAKPIVFSGHYDLALLDGAYGSKFEIKDGKAYGSGVLDMRGGIMISLFVIKALMNAGYKERPIKIIFAGDEEISHANARAGEIMQKEAEGGYIAFNMETGLIDNSLCIGRKGRTEYVVDIEGVEAHAGNDFESGRSAIIEMCYKLLKIAELTDAEAGTTVNPGVINGGTIANAVPKDCEAIIDIRYKTAQEYDRVNSEIKKILSETFVDGTTTKYEVTSEMPAYETTEDVLKFYDFVKKTAEKYGLEEVRSKHLGGVSDASYVTLAKTPCICSFGIQGQWNHTVREYAVVDSIKSRAKLISGVILDIDIF